MLLIKKRAPPILFVVREESFFLQYLTVSRLSVSLEETVSSLLAREDKEAPQPSNKMVWVLYLIIEIKKKAPSIFMRKKRAPAPQQLGRETPLASREIGELCLPVFIDKNKTLFSLSQGRELLTISTSSSKHGREPTIGKKGWSSSKLQNLTREVRSSPRPAKRNKKPSTSSSGTRRELTPWYSW